jgi:predicted DNA-binding mobile mystery protein A
MMDSSSKWLRLRQLDARLETWRNLNLQSSMPKTGWLKTIRKALGMSSKQLSQRVRLERSVVSRLEKAEVNGSVTFKSMRRAAEALDCEFVYALVPRKTLESMVHDAAAKIVDKEMKSTKRTMALEAQSPDEWVNKTQREDRINKLLYGTWRKLWS